MDEFSDRLSFPILPRIIELLPTHVPIYLVGGAVRDALLNRPNYDLDFVTQGDAIKIGRNLANAMGAAFFPLDRRRRVARLILKNEALADLSAGKPIRIDFSSYQGENLEEDLIGRDFTINAIAVDIRNLNNLIDPMGGAQDLVSRRLQVSSSDSFVKDPVRILRAVRFSVDLGLKILPETIQLLKQAVYLLPQVSPERLRDELFRILALPKPGSAVRILDMLQALHIILPEVTELKGITQSSPHVLDAFEHTLDSLNRLESVLGVLAARFDPDKASSLNLGLVSIQLGRYRKQLAEHLERNLNPDRSHLSLLFLAGLYHDTGKAKTRTINDSGKITFIRHDLTGSQLIQERARQLKLSNAEIEWLATIVKHHMRPSLLSHSGEVPGAKAIYRFFRDTGEAGVDICLLSMADVLATYGSSLPQERWANHLDVIRTLLSAWWEGREHKVFPPPLVNGDELMAKLMITSGPVIGHILDSIREAQVAGEIIDKDAAFSLAKKIYDEELNKKTG